MIRYNVTKIFGQFCHCFITLEVFASAAYGVDFWRLGAFRRDLSQIPLARCWGSKARHEVGPFLQGIGLLKLHEAVVSSHARARESIREGCASQRAQGPHP